MSKAILTNLDLSKNQILNASFQALATAPSNPSNYQYYFDTVDNVLKYYNGTSWEIFGTRGAVTFKGTLGAGGTITTLPLNKNAVLGDEYQVITAGTYTTKTGETKKALIGDMFICTKAGTTSASADGEWAYVPSGNDSYTGSITGDGTTTLFTVAHPLGTKDVIVRVYNSTDEEVITDVASVATGSVSIGFAVAPATTDTFRVVIHS